MDNLREKISFKEKASYGLGDVACGLVYVLSCTFITFFYTDGAGLNPAIIGSILMFSRLLDGVSDILVGYIVDRTKSKHGKARAWILRSSIPIAVCLVLTFTVPDSEGIWTYVYVAVTYNLVNSVCYTLVNVPYGTLNSLMTRDQGQRMVINTFRMTLAQVGAMVTNMFTIPFVNAMGGTGSKKAWIIVAVIYGIIAMVMLFICFFNTKERVSADEDAKKENISLFKAFKLAAKNQYWLILVVDTAKYTDKNPEVLIEELLQKGMDIPRLFLACGTEDELLGVNRRFKEFLSANNVKHEYMEDTGMHDWTFWNKCLVPAFDWLTASDGISKMDNPSAPADSPMTPLSIK